MLKITLDTNCIDDAALRAAAAAAGAEIATFSVARKEIGNSSFLRVLQGTTLLPEQTMWRDGMWADGVWADGRRETLEYMLSTRIRTPDETIADFLAASEGP